MPYYIITYYTISYYSRLYCIISYTRMHIIYYYVYCFIIFVYTYKYVYIYIYICIYIMHVIIHIYIYMCIYIYNIINVIYLHYYIHILCICVCLRGCHKIPWSSSCFVVYLTKIVELHYTAPQFDSARPHSAALPDQ